jgi:hypothetical protein
MRAAIGESITGSISRALGALALAGALVVAVAIDVAPAMDEARAVRLEARRARMQAEFGRLHTVRRNRRADVLSVPGVIGIGTETRENHTRACITVYVLRDTAEVRGAIESYLADVPLEIIEKPGGFRAY